MHPPDEMDRPRRLDVAVVAPTLRILGGHAVQAERILEGWQGDPDVHAWLVPINPVPPKPFAPPLGRSGRLSARTLQKPREEQLPKEGAFFDLGFAGKHRSWH